jgi:HPt (histidine-containing phosphotransfer) domain-containing protein
VLPQLLYAAVARWLAPRPSASAPGQPSSVPAPAPAPAPAAAAVAGANPDIIDLSILSQMVDGDPNKMRRYAALFVQAIPESMAELNSAVDQGHLPTLADLGHRMKSSARMVGALGLAGLCESLEGLRHTGTVADARGIVDKIPRMLSRISDDIAVALP